MLAKQNVETQLKTFQHISRNFPTVLSDFKNGQYDCNGKIKSEWNDTIEKLYALYKNGIPGNFLENSIITCVMFMNSQGDLMNHQFEFCKSMFSKEELDMILTESPIGQPPKAMLWEYSTTHNSIHQLYHVARYMRKTGKSFSTFNRIIEWGGGYGNFCKLIYSLPKSALSTYTIIDIPEISALQWLYLASVFGEEHVNIVSKQQKIQNGKINLVSLPNLDLIDDNYDCFISTWALSESPTYMHSFVAEEKNWFNSDSFLLAIHQCGTHIPFMNESTNVGILTKKKQCKFEDVRVIPGKNYYIFK